jgi:hypothetical protein
MQLAMLQHASTATKGPSTTKYIPQPHLPPQMLAQGMTDEHAVQRRHEGISNSSLTSVYKTIKKPSHLVRWSNKTAIGLHELRIAALLFHDAPRGTLSKDRFLLAEFSEGLETVTLLDLAYRFQCLDIAEELSARGCQQLVPLRSHNFQSLHQPLTTHQRARNGQDVWYGSWDSTSRSRQRWLGCAKKNQWHLDVVEFANIINWPEPDDHSEQVQQGRRAQALELSWQTSWEIPIEEVRKMFDTPLTQLVLKHASHSTLGDLVDTADANTMLHLLDAAMVLARWEAVPSLARLCGNQRPGRMWPPFQADHKDRRLLMTQLTTVLLAGGRLQGLDLHDIWREMCKRGYVQLARAIGADIWNQSKRSLCFVILDVIPTMVKTRRSCLTILNHLQLNETKDWSTLHGRMQTWAYLSYGCLHCHQSKVAKGWQALTLVELAAISADVDLLASEGTGKFDFLWDDIVCREVYYDDNWVSQSDIGRFYCDNCEMIIHIPFATRQESWDAIHVAMLITLKRFFGRAVQHSGLGLMQAFRTKALTNIHRLILAFATQRPKLAQFERVAGRTTVSWWKQHEPVLNVFA